MTDLDKATATQLANIEKRSGKTIAQLTAIVKKSTLTKVGELRDMLKQDLGMGHGDANLVVHVARNGVPSRKTAAAPDEALDAIYTGPKADLRPIHDAIMAAITPFGPFEVAPKKANVSLRGKKQFALIGPATKTQVEVGFNMKGVTPTARLVAIKPGGMCNYKVRLSSVDEVDAELVGWLRTAYDGAVA
jgi:hypothetical protein